MPNYNPVVLLILDGWGIRNDFEDNAISRAHTPQWDRWNSQYPHIDLVASGDSVGLPAGQMGNSEVGHMHIGAGRVIYQDLSRINLAIEQGDFFQIPLLRDTIENLKASGKNLHLAGLVSPGGIHSHENHLFAILKLCHEQQFDRVYIHCFLDGRDTPPQSAINSLQKLSHVLNQYPVGRIASISGRYYAMDRDNRWERILPVAKLIYCGQALYKANTASQAVEVNYQNQVSDEFIPPTQIGSPVALTEGDAFFFFNFRSDRARQLCHSLLEPAKYQVKNEQKSNISTFITMTKYAENIPSHAVFPPQHLHNTLGEVISKENMQQLRLAETEKYAHVTFFFNGGEEKVFPGEDRILIPSPRVATYDLQPEMSAPQVTKALVKAIETQEYDFIVCNYANADMVGHTGNFKATVEAIESLDSAFARIDQAIKKTSGCLLLTSDHGNAEQMFNQTTQQAHTAHTSEKVPLLFVGKGAHFKRQSGYLTDIAPTILSLLDIAQPFEMTGESLLEFNHDQ